MPVCLDFRRNEPRPYTNHCWSQDKGSKKKKNQTKNALPDPAQPQGEERSTCLKECPASKNAQPAVDGAGQPEGAGQSEIPGALPIPEGGVWDPRLQIPT